MNEARRRQALIGALAALGALVLADQLGLLPGRGAPPTDTPRAQGESARDARAQYLALAHEAARDAALIAQAPRWREAAERARAQWEDARRGMIAQRTAELAEARFRDLVLDALKDLNLAAVRAAAAVDSAGPAPGPAGAGESGGVRTISLEVRFDATDQREVYAALDRLENLADLRTNIASLRVDGPGRMQVSQTITATLILQAQAAVGAAAEAL